MKLSDFSGKFFDVVRDGEFATLGNVTSHPVESCLTFVTNEKYLENACRMQVFSCIICPRALVRQLPADAEGRGIAVADDPKSAFQLFHNWLTKQDVGYVAPLPKTEIGANCTIHESAHISPVGVKIGDRVTVEANAVIYPGVTIEDDVYICAGAVIGADCILVGTMPNGDLFRLAQTGGVKIGKNAFLGHYAYIGRGMFPYECTIIGENSCIGYAVEISHNCQVGKNCIVLDQSQICGNTVLEDGARVAPHAIVSNRLRIGDGATADIGSVVVNNVRSGMRVAGNFAIEHDKFLLWHRKKLHTKD